MSNTAEEQKAYEKMEYYIRDKKIFIDTCSLLYEHADEFWSHFYPLLQRNNQKVIIPYRCIEELERISKSEDTEKAKKAQKAIENLGRLQNENILDIRGEKNDNFADNVFLVQFTKFRMSYNLLLITQDRTLGKEILELNNSEAVKGNKIRVFRINQYGFLSKHEYEEKLRDSAQRNNAPLEKFDVAKTVTAIPNTPLSVSIIPVEGSSVICDGKNIKLIRELGTGGEGSIYETDTPYVAKIYKKDKITQRKFSKLKLMISKHVKYDGICYPIGIIYNEQNEFVGYLMPKANGKELGRSIFIKPLFLRNFPDWKKKDTVKLCITILKKIKYLNDRNIILGDINPANILVVGPEEVYLVDTDSYQIGEFPCPVGTPYYTAPEIQRKDFSEFLRTQGNENFAIATLLFMIMIPGKSPYAQQGGEDAIANIINMDFSYPFGNNSNKKTPDGPWRFIWSHLTYDLKEAFYNTFRKEGKNSKENNRLSAEEWLKIFGEYFYLLSSGKFGEQDQMSEELFPSRFKKNPDVKYSKCKLCGYEIEENRLTEGICHNCLQQGEIYKCKSCGKEILYTNYQKYIKKSKKYEICYDCKTHADDTYAELKCQDCGKSFSFTNRDYQFYRQKGYEFPKRCPACREKRKNSQNNYSSKTTNHSSSYSSGCYITTAVCEYYGKSDDCVELKMLRVFRDKWLAAQPEGLTLIHQYYDEAPVIVEWLKKSNQYEELCSYLLNQYIFPCVQLVKEGEYQKCKSMYQEMVKELKERREKCFN